MTQTGEASPEELKSEAQALEGYLCSCGLQEFDVNQFKKHMLVTSKDRKNHESRGRVNFDTGQIIMPPAKDRTKEQWKIAKYGNKPESVATAGKDGKPATQMRTVDILSQATQIRLVPRIYTIDYSPVMRAGHQAVHELWGWPIDTTLGEILDTIIITFFKDRGVTLAGYIIEETPEEREFRLAAIEKNKAAAEKVKDNGGESTTIENKQEVTA